MIFRLGFITWIFFAIAMYFTVLRSHAADSALISQRCDEISKTASSQGLLESLHEEDLNIHKSEIQNLTELMRSGEIKDDSLPILWNTLTEICPNSTRSCYHWLPWILSQHSSPTVRKVAHLWALRLIQERSRQNECEETPFALDSIRSFEARNFSRAGTADSEIHRQFQSRSKEISRAGLSSLRTAHLTSFSKKAPQLSLASGWVCAHQPNSVSCLTGLSASFKTLKPALVSGEDFRDIRFLDSLTMSMPHLYSMYIGNTGTFEILRKMNQLLFQRIKDYEAGKIDFNASLYSDLLGIIQTLAPKSYPEHVRKAAIGLLGLYSSRGASLSEYYDFFDEAYWPTISELFYFSTAINLLDSYQFAAKKNHYSIPHNVYSSCLTTKPYHFWMSAYLADQLSASLSSEEVRAGVHAAGVTYEFLAATVFRSDKNIFKESRRSLLLDSIRSNIAWNDAGLFWRLKATDSFIDYDLAFGSALKEASRPLVGSWRFPGKLSRYDYDAWSKIVLPNLGFESF